MPDHIPSLCFAVPREGVPEILLRNRQIFDPKNGDQWHDESVVVEEVIYDLVNVAHESGRLWLFTSTNHWYDRMVADIADGLGVEGLMFVRSFYTLLDNSDLQAAARAVDAVMEQMRRDPLELPAKSNSDFGELLRQLPDAGAFAGARVSREVNEWESDNPFASYVLSLRAAISEATVEGSYLVWYPTHA